MAIDPDKMRRMRAEKARQRQQQAANRKKLFIRLAIAAVILTLCGFLIFSMKKPESSSQKETQPSVTETTAPEESTEPTFPVPSSETLPPESDPTQPTGTDTIHLAFAGDLNVTDRVAASGGDSRFSDTFMDVAHLFADADLAALNFEGNLCGEPYGTETRSAPQDMMNALSRAGVDFIQLANSYSIFNGTSGLRSTITGVRSAGMEPLGTYAEQKDFEAGKGYVIREVQGIRIAFTAFTKGMDGMALPEGSEHCVNVLYTDYDSAYQKVDTEGITQVLKAIEEEKPDLVVAMLHWGSEFNDTISKSQKQIVELMQANGVDAIIGSHSHYVQKIEYDQTTGKLVAYSLGDFCGDARRAGSEYSIILNIEVTRNNATGEVKISGYSYTPTFSVVEQGKPVRVMRIKEAIEAYEGSYISRVSEGTYNKMQYALGRIDARVHSD